MGLRIAAGLLAVVVLAAGGGAAPAHAQSARQALQSTEFGDWTRFEREERRRRRPSWVELREHYGAARVELSRRVDDLIHMGRCGDARRLALEAGDRNMAVRARQICPGETGVVTPRGRRLLAGE